MSAITSQSWPTSGRTCADHHKEIGFMLRALRQHPLLTATTEVLADAARYVAIMLVVLLLLGQLARVGL
jgi:hypothetical protein